MIDPRTALHEQRLAPLRVSGGAYRAVVAVERCPRRPPITARKIVDREHDQVLRMWMPFGANFVMFQPHLRNFAGGVLRGTIGYGSPTIARLWLDK